MPVEVSSGGCSAEFDALSKIYLGRRSLRSDCQRIRSYDRCDRRQGPGRERPIPDILQTISLFIAGENFASANALLEPLLKKDPANLELAFLFAKTKLGLSDFESAVFCSKN